MCWARSRLCRSGGGGVGALGDVGGAAGEIVDGGEETIESLVQGRGRGSDDALGRRGARDGKGGAAVR